MVRIKLSEGIFEYDVARPLGKRGGYGQVFSGRNAIGDAVAIKKLHLSSAEAAHRELRIAAELRGKPFAHIIPVLAAGEDADSGDYFVVMACAEGNLEDYRTKSGTLTATEVSSVLGDILAGLVEAGDWVHRDIKPANILRHESRWKIADFGIARFYEEATASNTLKSALTPHYAAPEQWRMERATHATDAYALGCIGFFLIVGVPPFVSDPEREHQTAVLPKFSSAEPRLDSLIQLLVRKSPETRPSFSRTRTLLGEVDRAQNNQTTSAKAASMLATVGARLAREDQERQAQQLAYARERTRRTEAARIGLEVIQDNFERLWGKIHAAVPTAQRTDWSGNQAGYRVTFGGAALSLTVEKDLLEATDFPVSGWDIMLGGSLSLRQAINPYKWGTSLWFGRRGTTDTRWFEIGYYALKGGDAPIGLSPPDAAEASGPGLSNLNVALGPWEIDDEAEDDFHSRVLWLLTRAAMRQLSHPRYLPIKDWSGFAN